MGVIAGLKTVAPAPRRTTLLLINFNLSRGGRQQLLPKCACSLITQPSLIIKRHIIQQIKAEYHSYPMVLIV